MFTGIIKNLGKITKIEQEGSNVHLTIETPLAQEVSIDQSVAHNGVCLTVIEKSENDFVVTAIDETIQKSTLGQWKQGEEVNLELAMKSGALFDGHMVQGHVDHTATCIGKEDVDGSWNFRFKLPDDSPHLVVDKGSVCINGVSLTVVDPVEKTFGVSIIPYTYEHTTFKNIEHGTDVNIEFDIIGKYLQRYLEQYKSIIK